MNKTGSDALLFDLADGIPDAIASKLFDIVDDVVGVILERDLTRFFKTDHVTMGGAEQSFFSCEFDRITFSLAFKAEFGATLRAMSLELPRGWDTDHLVNLLSDSLADRAGQRRGLSYLIALKGAGDVMAKGVKPAPPFHLDMGFDEALERFAGTKPSEVEASIERGKQTKPPGGKRKRKPPDDKAESVVDLRRRRIRKRDTGR